MKIEIYILQIQHIARHLDSIHLIRDLSELRLCCDDAIRAKLEDERMEQIIALQKG